MVCLQNRGWSHDEVPLLRGLPTRPVEELHWSGENQVRESNYALSGPLAGARGRQLQGQGPGMAHALQSSAGIKSSDEIRAQWAVDLKTPDPGQPPLRNHKVALNKT